MNKLLKVTVILSTIFLLFIIFYMLDHGKQASAIDDEVDKDMEEDTQADIEVRDLLLPLEHSKERTKQVTHVMLHFSSNVTANPEAPYQVEDIYTIFTEYGVSAHYLIGREGDIYKLVTEDRIAYHAGAGSLPHFPEYENKLNDHSIGIELLAIGTEEEMADFITEDAYDSLDPNLIGYTDAQYESLDNLLNAIHARHSEVEKNRKHVIGHDEYAPERKNDPGALFEWGRIGY